MTANRYLDGWSNGRKRSLTVTTRTLVGMPIGLGPWINSAAMGSALASVKAALFGAGGGVGVGVVDVPGVGLGPSKGGREGKGVGVGVGLGDGDGDTPSEGGEGVVDPEFLRPRTRTLRCRRPRRRSRRCPEAGTRHAGR